MQMACAKVVLARKMCGACVKCLNLEGTDKWCVISGYNNAQLLFLLMLTSIANSDEWWEMAGQIHLGVCMLCPITSEEFHDMLMFQVFILHANAARAFEVAPGQFPCFYSLCFIHSILSVHWKQTSNTFFSTRIPTAEETLCLQPMQPQVRQIWGRWEESQDGHSPTGGQLCLFLFICQILKLPFLQSLKSTYMGRWV